MDLSKKHGPSLVWGLRCLLILLSVNGIYGTVTDVKCLKKVYDSIKDPNGYLNITWDFNNHTEGAICRFSGIQCWHPDENRVLTIKLSDMGLKGPFPLGLDYCTSLTGLDLSGNNFNGSLPSNISKYIGFVTNLDLSDNDFSGQIPASLANCTYLNDVNLDHNLFSGQIPLQLGSLSRIKSFSVANNNLSGQVPEFQSLTVPIVNYANNPGLCGAPLDACPTQTKSHLAYIAGGAAGGLTFIIALTGIAFIYISKMKIIRKKMEDPEGNRWAKSMKGTKAIKVKFTMLFMVLSSFSGCHIVLTLIIKIYFLRLNMFASNSTKSTHNN